MDTSDTIAIVAAIISAVSAATAVVSILIAKKTADMNAKMFRRQGVIDLHMAWNGVREINASNPQIVDVVRAVNALGLTATLWNHDIIEKDILYQNYWEPYRDIYDTLYSMVGLIPGSRKTGRDLLTPEMENAYEGMKKLGLNAVRVSSVS